jgi:tetratricopeptide (TPR) repeat protein
MRYPARWIYIIAIAVLFPALPVPFPLQAKNLKEYHPAGWNGFENPFLVETCGKNFISSLCNQSGSKADWNGAITTCTKLIKQKPKCGAAYRARAEANLQKGQIDATIADLTGAVGLDPGLWITYRYRAAAYQRKPDLAKAMADLDKAVAIEPRASILHNDRGIIFYQNKRYDLALRAFDQAIKNGGGFICMINRANMLQELRRKDEALEQYQKVVDLKSKDWQLYYELGNALKNYGYFLDAAEAFLRANAFSEQSGIYLALGDSYMEAGQYDRARRAYYRASDLAPLDQLGPISALVWEAVYFSANYPDALYLAVQGLSRAEDAAARDLWTRKLGLSHLAMGKYKNAAEVLQQTKILGIDYRGAEGGVLVNRIYKNSPADLAGLRAGDMLVEINGIPVSATTPGINEILDQKTVYGTKANFKLMRNGAAIETNIHIGVPAVN